MPELETDILIVGASTGGTAAAIALARLARGGGGGGSTLRCIVTEPTDWIGGQLTSQAVPPDENQWIEDPREKGANDSYRAWRTGVRTWYRQHRRLSAPHDAAAAESDRLNPGNAWVSRLACEPRIAHAVLIEMLGDSVARGVVKLLLRTEPVAAEVDGDRIRAVHFRNLDTGEETLICARYILEATETGDLLELAGVEHRIGAESHAQTGEMHARTDKPDPFDQQPISYCFALEHRPGEDHTIAPPTHYDFFRDYVPDMTPPWPGKLFSWDIPRHDHSGPRTLMMVPPPDTPEPGQTELWRYRRIVDPSLYDPAFAAREGIVDVSLINWVQMDYWQKPLLGVTPEERSAAVAGAREQSLCWLHWLQTEAPRHDGGGTGYPGLKLRGDELGTPDGFAKAPYIREPRRLEAVFTLTEAHVGTEQRRAEGRPNMDATGSGTGEPFEDTVGVGHYRIDLHPSTSAPGKGGRNSIFIPATPFRVPFGALLPVRVNNLIAAGKSLGVTHISNGCTRLHPVEWGIGEAAALLAAWCLDKQTTPHTVRENKEALRDCQSMLAEQGVKLRWSWE